MEELARVTGNDDVIRIHLGDEADGKTLLGMYVCTDVAGEFKWQPGALTQAVTEGKWILIEDLDLASVEVISILLPVLETRTLCVTSRGEEIVASPGFRIFTTCTQSSDRNGPVRHSHSFSSLSFSLF